jgi:hypothetical protein
MVTEVQYHQIDRGLYWPLRDAILLVELFGGGVVIPIRAHSISQPKNAGEPKNGAQRAFRS